MDRVRTVELGQFEDDHAEQIRARLHEAGIVVWAKRSGAFARVLFAGDWGTRLFVDQERMDEARAIADDLTGA